MDQRWVRIIRVENGYIVEVPDYDIYDVNTGIMIRKEVFEDIEDELGDIDSLVDALRFIEDQIGPSTSRYSKKRVKISIEPGDKYEEIEDGN